MKELRDYPWPVIALAYLCIISSVVALLAGVLGGCRRPEPARPTVIIERRACLAKEPPVPVEPVVAGKGQGCPPPFIACMKRQPLIDLVIYLREVRRYARDAFTSCGPIPVSAAPAAPTPPGGTP